MWVVLSSGRPDWGAQKEETTLSLLHSALSDETIYPAAFLHQHENLLLWIPAQTKFSSSPEIGQVFSAKLGLLRPTSWNKQLPDSRLFQDEAAIAGPRPVSQAHKSP